jgi:hypothetical protein
LKSLRLLLQLDQSHQFVLHRLFQSHLQRLSRR